MTSRRFNGSAWVDMSIRRRFNGSAWIDMQYGRRFNGSAWIDMWTNGTYLYKDGDECATLTGGWLDGLVYNGSACILTKSPSLQLAKTAQGNECSRWVRTANPINLTNFTTLIFDWSCSGGGTGNHAVGVHIHTSPNLETSDVSTVALDTFFTRKKQTIDVSALNGSYYIGFHVSCNQAKIATGNLFTLCLT